jgi:hypothetical protein
MLYLYYDALSLISDAVGENTAVGKAAAVASTIISTYSSAQKAYKQKEKNRYQNRENCSKKEKQQVEKTKEQQSKAEKSENSYEPYAAREVKKEKIPQLLDAGFEIEYLGTETLVLRSIPDWINGFPLKDIVTCLLEGKSLQSIQILPADWSTSSWEEMLGVVPLDMQMEKKIVLDLKHILTEKFK